MAGQTNDLVRHNGRTYRLADLKTGMCPDQRETAHFAAAHPDNPREFWAEFVALFPVSADQLAEATPAAQQDS